MTGQPSALIAAAVACFGLVSGAAAETIDRHFQERFDVAPGARLRLDHGDGDVVVTPWDQDVLEVEVRYHVEYRRVGVGTTPDLDVEFRRSGDRIEVIGHERGSFNFGFFFYSKQYEHRYAVRAPAYLALDLRGDDGDVTIEGWRAEMSLRIEDGDVRAHDLAVPAARFRLEDGDLTIDGFQGELLVEAEDGDVVLHDCRTERAEIRVEDGDVMIDGGEGSFEIASEDGDVDLRRMRASRLRVYTADGDAWVGLLPSDDLDFEARTGDGNVRLALERGVSAAFSVDTDDGRVRVDADSAVDVQRSRHRVSGLLGEARGRIQITTADGSVTLTES